MFIGMYVILKKYEVLLIMMKYHDKNVMKRWFLIEKC